MRPYTILKTYVLRYCTFSTLHGLQTLDPFTACGYLKIYRLTMVSGTVYM